MFDRNDRKKNFKILSKKRRRNKRIKHYYAPFFYMKKRGLACDSYCPTPHGTVG